jgi:transposase
VRPPPACTTLTTFADGLRRERTELLAALALRLRTGPVEGHSTRLKLIKRRVCSRPGFATLNHLFLQAA